MPSLRQFVECLLVIGFGGLPVIGPRYLYG